MILSNQLSRSEALKLLNEPLYNETELKEDIAYISNKLNLSEEELLSYINSPGTHYTNYKNWDKTFNRLKIIQKSLEKFYGNKVRNYS